MKILVTSDTHGSYSDISDYIITNNDIDLLIHAGDGVEDVRNISYETGIDYYTVKGNNDFFINEDYEKVIEIAGNKIFLSHGHKYGVDFSYDNILEKAKEFNCEIAIFGHIHTYINKEVNGILLLNPGSPSLPRDGVRSFVILEIDEEIKLTRVSLD